MKSNEAILERIEKEIDVFINEWKSLPLKWLKEIDVQCELYSRLVRASVEGGWETMSVKFGKYSTLQNGHPIVTRRVCCEGYIKAGERELYMHPDVVVWDSTYAPDEDMAEGRLRMLWACEIKYTDDKPDESDIPRLQSLLDNNLVSKCCALVMVLHTKHGSYKADDLDKNARLQVRKVHAQLLPTGTSNPYGTGSDMATRHR